MSDSLGDEIWQALVDASDRVVLVHDATGVLRVVSRAASAVFPGLVPGALLTEVDGFEAADDDKPFEMLRLGLRWQWRPERISADHLAWHGSALDDAEPWCENCADARFLANTSRLLGNSLDPEHTLRAVVQLAVPTLADCCAAVLPARRGRLEWWRFSRDGALEHGRVGQHALRAISGLPEAFADAGARPGRGELADEEWPDWLLPPELGEPASLTVVPLRHLDLTAGALILVNGRQRGELEAARWDLVRDYAVRAATALNSAHTYTGQAEAVAILEASLMPGPLPELPGTVLSAAYRPARQAIRVGGDFYDVYPSEEGALFVLGDVCGNGVEAAALAGRIGHSIEALRLVETRPAQLLHLLNQAILSSEDNRFATLVVGSMTRTAGGRLELALASGGHPSPVLLRADGAVEQVALPGTLVGVLPDPHFGEATVVLEPGDVCLLYSDGVTEARGGRDGQEQFGVRRLGEAMSGSVGISAADLTGQVQQRLDGWLAGRDHDDIALLAVQAVAD